MFLRKNIFIMFILSLSLSSFVSAGNQDDVKKIKDETKFDLEYCDLSDEDLKGVVAWGKNFNYGNLSKANFEDAKFNFEKEETGDFPSCFFKATLVKTIFNGAYLRNCDFSGADLRGVKFIGADLSGANFRGAIFDGETDFTRAFVDGAKFDLSIKPLAKIFQFYLIKNRADSPHPNSPELRRSLSRKGTPSPSALIWNVEREDEECGVAEVFEYDEESIVDKLEKLAVGYKESEKPQFDNGGISPWNM